MDIPAIDATAQAVAHTPTPWVHDGTLPTKVYSTDLTGAVIARCAGPGFEFVTRSAEEADANARLIVRAVNAHDDLVAALQAWKKLQDYRGEDVQDFADHVVDLVDAALAKAAAG